MKLNQSEVHFHSEILFEKRQQHRLVVVILKIFQGNKFAKEIAMVTKSSTCKGKNGALSTYSSEYEAECGADQARVYGKIFSPYQCIKCGFWHLSPKERQTPSRECTCTDSRGRHKQLYETKEAAEIRAQIIENERGEKLNIYECPRQDGWHLTHKHF